VSEQHLRIDRCERGLRERAANGNRIRHAGEAETLRPMIAAATRAAT
jgi:hypothetical protein